MEFATRLNHPYTRLMVSIVSACCIVLATACSTPATPESLPPIPTLQTLRLGYPPALLPWAQAARQCANSLPDTAFYAIELADGARQDLEIRLEIFSEAQDSAQELLYTIGQEQVVFIVNPANPLTSLDNESLSAILSGRIKEWQELDALAPSSSTPFTQTVSLLSFPPGDPLQAAVALATNTYPPPQTRLLPDPGAMLQVVSEDAGAIGYVPLSWYAGADPDSIHQIVGSPITLSIVARSTAQPAGPVKAILLCLQNP